MKLTLTVFEALCATQTFVINGVRADHEDFGVKEDVAEDEAEPYCCGNMLFVGKKPTAKVLKKYSITKSEYSEVRKKLEEVLSFGPCGLCS